jgi:hypothetical protein
MDSIETVTEFTHAARACAMQMFSNANYILRELPGIEVPAELRPKIESVCQNLISTKHDVITEIGELAELADKGASETNLIDKMEMTGSWLMESIQEMHELVQEVEQLVARDPHYDLLFFLIIESAANIATSRPV